MALSAPPVPVLSSAARYRWAVASRAVAAIAGGYLVSALAAMAMALYLPLPRAEAVLAGTLSSFAVYACVVIWVFAVRSAWRAWGGLSLAVLILGLACLGAGT